MARTVHDTNLSQPTARLRLPVQGKPHWRTLESGFHLGYRRLSNIGGTWLARRFLGAGKYAEKRLGTADDLQASDGVTVLSFAQAQNEARTWWKAEERKGAGLEPETGPYTVEQALKDYFAHRMQKGSKGAKADQHAANARIVPVLGNVETAKLTARAINDWHTALAKKPRLVRTGKLAAKQATKAIDAKDPEQVRARQSTANRVLTVLKAALNLAFQEGRIAFDLAWRKVKPFAEVDAPRVRYLSNPECVRLVNACPPDFRNLVRGALMTGCRYGELARLTVADFNADSGAVTVRISKAGKSRTVALTEEGRAFFASHCAGKLGKSFIFTRADGEAWGASHQQRPLVAASALAKIEPAASFHILRHTYASLLAMRGVPMGVIAAQLGHADTRMKEKHYAHLAPSYVADTVRAAMTGLGITEAVNIVPLHRNSGALAG